MNEDKEIKKATELESIFRRVPKWQDLWFYQKSEVLYQMTYVFCERFLPKHGDRTVDQMVQAARSGKQNIVEGNADIETSLEMGIKLINVAKSSLRELLADYEDFLRVNGFEQWQPNSDKYLAMRKLGREGDNADILNIAKSRPLDVVANMAIILLKQEDYLLHQFIASLSKRFLQEGGFKEKMFSLRQKVRYKGE